MGRLSPGLLDQLASSARRVLTQAAREHRTVTYGNLMGLLGITDAQVEELIGEISEREHAQGRPLLSAIVLDRGSPPGPGPGFWELSMVKGLPLSQRQAFWREVCLKVWAFPWPSD